MSKFEPCKECGCPNIRFSYEMNGTGVDGEDSVTLECQKCHTVIRFPVRSGEVYETVYNASVELWNARQRVD